MAALGWQQGAAAEAAACLTLASAGCAFLVAFLAAFASTRRLSPRIWMRVAVCTGRKERGGVRAALHAGINGPRWRGWKAAEPSELPSRLR